MRTACALGLCLAAIALAACGGGGGSTSGAGSSTTTVAASDISQPGPLGAGPQRRSADGTARPPAKAKRSTTKPSSAKPSRTAERQPRKRSPKPTGPADHHYAASRPVATEGAGPKLVRVPPISSTPRAGSKKAAPGVKTIPGADNSVQEYGVEADESGRREAAVVLQAYLNDRLEENWTAACAALGQKPRQQLEEAAESATRQGTEVSGCAETMALFREAPAQLSEQATITEVLSFRGGGDVAGDPSYLIFSAPPSNSLFSMPMYLEEGSWKVGLTRAAQLPA